MELTGFLGNFCLTIQPFYKCLGTNAEISVNIFGFMAED